MTLKDRISLRIYGTWLWPLWQKYVLKVSFERKPMESTLKLSPFVLNVAGGDDPRTAVIALRGSLDVMTRRLEKMQTDRDTLFLPLAGLTVAQGGELRVPHSYVQALPKTTGLRVDRDGDTMVVKTVSCECEKTNADENHQDQKQDL